MNKKIFENARFCPKGDIEANWNKANGFIPLNKEIIIYKPDENHNAARFKIGDGRTAVQDLPFSGTNIDEIQKLVDERGQLLIDYVDNAVAAIEIPQPDWNQHDENAADYIKNKPFGEKNFFEPITWDGVVGYKEKVDVSDFISGGTTYAVKVSDAILTYEDYLGATVKVMTPDGERTEQIPESELIPKDEVDIIGVCGALSLAFTIIDVNKFNSALGVNLFKVPGTYVIYAPNDSVYISLLSKSEISKIDEKYLPDSIDDRIAELEGRIITAIFNVVSENTTITLQNLEGMAKIDWGDGTINSSYQHTYNIIGEYECKIYGVTSIGEAAFYDCNSLTSITIPDSVTSIGGYAFYGCSGLVRIIMPKGVATIGESAFYDCRSLTSVVIPDNVTSIGYNAFRNCYSLTSVTIPNSVTAIGNYAFYYCNSLTSIEIPDSVTSIGSAAFRDCTSLTSVVIGDSVTTIDSSVFLNCSSLMNITCPAFAISYIPKTNLQTVVITSGATINSAMFRGCSKLKSVVIPDSVTQIGNNAFYNCSGLTEIQYNATECADFSVDNYIFYNAGKNGEGITVTIGANVKKIPAYMFYPKIYDSSTAPKIVSVIFEEGSVCESIGIYAFYNCSSLKNIVIPNNVISIGSYAFYDCNSLTSVIIPDSVTTIGYWAFSYCDSLTSVVIPDSVTTIGDYVFAYCDGLTSLKFKGISPATITQNVFYNTSNLKSIIVPKGTLNDYQSSWSEFLPESILKLIVEDDFNREVYYSDLESYNINYNIENGSGPKSIKQVDRGGEKGNTFTFYRDGVCSNPNADDYAKTLSPAPFQNETINGKDGQIIHDAVGVHSSVFGGISRAIGDRSQATGSTTIAVGEVSHTEGTSTVTFGANSHAEGFTTTSIGDASHSEGSTTVARGPVTHAEGYATEAIGEAAHSQGYQTKAIGAYSHTEGFKTEARKDTAHAEGMQTIADGEHSHTEGIKTEAQGHASHAQGGETKAVGSYSHAGGYKTVAGYGHQTVIGLWNNNKSNTLFEVGNGTSNEDRHNVFEVYKNGTAKLNDKFIATENFVKEQLVGKTDYLGTVAAIPNFLDVGAGDYCRVSTEFVYDASTGEMAHVGDILIAVKDNPTQSKDDWDLLHNELASATLVTVGGVAQTSWSADTAVAKQENTGSMNVVYGEEHSGKGSKMFTLASSGTGDMTIPIRNANGQFDVGEPQSDLNVVNKKYVDDLIAELRAEIEMLKTQLSTMTAEITSADIDEIFDETEEV